MVAGKKKRRNVADAAADDFDEANPSQSAAMDTEQPTVEDDTEVTATKNEAEEMETESAAADPVWNGSAADDSFAASDGKKQPGPDGGGDPDVLNNDVLNNDVRTSSSDDLVLGNSGAAPESSSTRDKGEVGKRTAQVEKAGPEGTAAGGMMPPIPNHVKLASESPDLLQSTARKSDTSDREGLIPPDEVEAVTATFLPDAEADRVILKLGSLRSDLVPSSGPNYGDDETVCTTEGKLEEYSNQGADGGDDDMNEHTTVRDGALLARIKTLEEKNARLEAENARMKLVEAKNAILEAENARLRREVNVNKGAEG